MNALHEQFVAEARDLIHQATNDLIAIEREGGAAERIDRIFRAFHTLKGSAGVVELPAMIMTMHAAEDLLAAIHGGRLAATPAMIDRALACLDQVSGWVNHFEAEGSAPPDAGEQAQATVRDLRAFLAAGPVAIPEKSKVAGSNDEGHHTLPDWASRLIQAAREPIARHVQAKPTALVAISYEPRPGCFFDGDDPLALMRAIPDLVAFHLEPRDAWPPLGELDPYACNLRLQAISAGRRDTLLDIFRLVRDQVFIVDLPVEALAPGTEATDSGDARELVRAIIDNQRKVLAAADGNDDLNGRVGAAARVAVNALRYHRRSDLVAPIETGMADALAQSETTPLISALDHALTVLQSPTPPPPGGDRPTVQPTAAEPAAARTLRLDEARIDALFNLAGELIIAKNGFAHLAKRIEAELGGHELARDMKREQESIERLAGEMQAAILQLRMVPVAQVFRSFPRVVRDMAQRLGKKATLVSLGETTAADKAIVDRLFEPLLHLVRNSLDHGVESPEQRRAAGKPETATLTLQASQRGDRFIVEVADDGRGIDPEIVKRRAIERNLLEPGELSTLSDEQALNLIFAPGFSTATEVSDISGRGVGMDIVRTAIDQIGGRVSLTSHVGIGTTVRLDLPMNIAMTRVMAVEAAGEVFGIPMDAVTETVRLTPERVSQIKGNEGFILRERIVPICSLAEMMNLPRAFKPKAAVRLLVVIEAAGRIVAIEVDAIQDRLEVVLKPMQGLLANARGYAGTTLLGDGRVLLVLDIKEMLP